MKAQTGITLVIGFWLSLSLLAPEIADYLSISFNFGFLHFFSNGAHYMAVFFHEIGHSIFYWFYGYPSIPSFDTHHGGGMAYGFERKTAILVLFYLASLYGLFIHCKDDRPWQIFILYLVALHLGTAYFENVHLSIIAYMGHGFEILIGGFFLYRALLNHAPRGMVERVLNALFGFFFIFRNMLMDIRLLTDLDFVHNYRHQKGQEDFGDFSQITKLYEGVTLDYVAIFTLICCTLAILTPAAIYAFALSTGRHYEIK